MKAFKFSVMENVLFVVLGKISSCTLSPQEKKEEEREEESSIPL